MAEVRGNVTPAAVALWRVLCAQLRARDDDPAFTHRRTITRGELRAMVRQRARALPKRPVVVQADEPEAVLVEALSGLWARQPVRILPASAGEAMARQIRTMKSEGLAFCTSGTTGPPRATPSKPGIRTLAQRLGVIGALPPLIHPTVASLAPIDRGHGMAALVFTLLLGGHFVLGDEAIRRIPHADVLTGVPLQLHEFADDPPTTGFGLVLSGSDRLVDAERLERVLGAPVHDAYGATETGTLTLASPEDRRRSPGTVGRPLPFVRIREESGLLVVKAPALGRGEFAADRGCIAGGLVHVTGRADDVVVSGGVNIPVGAIRDWLRSRPEQVELRWADDARFSRRLEAVVDGDTGPLRTALKAEFGIAAPRVTSSRSRPTP